MKLSLFVIVSTFVFAKSGVREVKGTSCNILKINLGLGMTTQLVLEQEPKVTLYADKKHFKITTNQLSPRSLAIIPFIEGSELNLFRDANGLLPSSVALAKILDRNFKTNLFVFFDNHNQLMFELRFVDKVKADYLVKVSQLFSDECVL